MNSDMDAKATLKSTLYLEQELIKGGLQTSLLQRGSIVLGFRNIRPIKPGVILS